MSTSEHKLFEPIKVGDITLSHRLVFAPCTRLRSTKTHEPTELMAQYYAQRASVPGTLLIVEATLIAARTGGIPFFPGIWSDEQVVAWKKLTDGVHEKGCYIYLQLVTLGRAADPEVLSAEDPSFPYVSASDVQLTGQPKPPRPMTIAEIEEYKELYAIAASNAVHRAGFDGVEIHGAHGCLVDQFIQDVSNKRTDKYGGSVENRSRFALEVVDSVAKVIGQEKTALRLSPFSDFSDMHMADPYPTFTYLVTRLAEDFPNLAYLHLVEPRAAGGDDRTALEGESNDFLRKIWLPRPLITAGGYTRETAIAQSDKTGELIAIGRYWLSNPDLPVRFKKNIPLVKYDRSTFYTQGPEGYIDWPYAEKTA